MDFVSGLIEQNKNPVMEEGDYTADGLLHCGKCNTPKQTVITHPFTGEETKVNCICKCQKEQMEREEKEQREREIKRARERKRYSSFEDSDYLSCTFESDDGQQPEKLKQMRNYAKHFQTFREKGQGLLLFGDVGTGKTFYSACIANELIDNGYKVLMTNFPSLIAKIQAEAFNEDLSSKLNRYDLLIVDDLGVERSTEYMQEHVYNIVDGRYRAGKPIIVSTNLTSEELKHPKNVMAARIYGRILEKCLPIKFTGPDKRKQNTCYKEMAELLNG